VVLCFTDRTEDISERAGARTSVISQLSEHNFRHSGGWSLSVDLDLKSRLDDE